MFGLPVAVLIACGAATGSGLALTNFLPLLGGANVVLDHFPANPSTWYFGTYLHLLMLWAVLLRRSDHAMDVAAAVAIEIPARAALIASAGPSSPTCGDQLGRRSSCSAWCGSARRPTGEDEPAGGGARGRPRHLVCIRRVARDRRDVSVHDRPRLARADRPLRGLQRRVVPLSLRGGAGLRGGSPGRRAGTGDVRRGGTRPSSSSPTCRWCWPCTPCWSPGGELSGAGGRAIARLPDRSRRRVGRDSIVGRTRTARRPHAPVLGGAANDCRADRRTTTFLSEKKMTRSTSSSPVTTTATCLTRASEASSPSSTSTSTS